ncbi:hypothetical protein N7451_005048 [Penicillium sp. IBT 35674x]|nr:hypothetical protein N7451_005048 [Penicillium sp. IBT 35674x]
MKFSEILAFSVAFATATAAPTKRTDTVEITFHGAAGAQFTQSFPTDDTATSISNPLSISKISSNTNLVECSFTGVDGSFTTVDGAVSSDVGPPQTQVSGTCVKLPSRRRRTHDVVITFIGAADAQFTQSFPIDDTVQRINNPLSISHISNSDDGMELLRLMLDPPQTQVSGRCFELPTPARRSYGAKVTFIGAADAQFVQYFPIDGLTYSISNVLSISHIELDKAGVTCTFDGVDNSVTSVTGPETVDVGPPQTQVKGTCWAN